MSIRLTPFRWWARHVGGCSPVTNHPARHACDFRASPSCSCLSWVGMPGKSGTSTKATGGASSRHRTRYLLWTAKGHGRPRAIAKITKWVPIVLCSIAGLWDDGVLKQFLWPKHLLSLRAIWGGGKNQNIPGVLAAKVELGACVVQVLLWAVCA